MNVMSEDWLTTGEAAKLLGVSRQHVVDLCDRGAVSFAKPGSHRRLRRSDVQRLAASELTQEQEKSLWLHRALLGPLTLDPARVLQVAKQNIARWKPRHRADGMAMHYLQRWEEIIDSGVDAVAEVFTSQDRGSSELRQNTPFAGVLSDDERRQVLKSFREHRQREHAAE